MILNLLEITNIQTAYLERTKADMQPSAKSGEKAIIPHYIANINRNVMDCENSSIFWGPKITSILIGIVSISPQLFIDQTNFQSKWKAVFTLRLLICD